MKLILIAVLFVLNSYCRAEDIKIPKEKVVTAAGKEKINLLLDAAKYYLKRNPSKSIDAAQNALQVSTSINDVFSIGRSLFAIAEYQYLQGNNYKALNYFQKALDCFNTTKTQQQIAQTYTKMGIIQRIFGNFDTALDYDLKALKIFEELRDSAGLATNYNEIGLVYRNLGQPEKAISNFNWALELSRKINNRYEMAKSINYIGNYYYFKNEITTADSCYREALSTLNKEIVEDDFYAGILNNLGNCYREKGDIKKALEYYVKSLNVSERLGDKNLLSVTYKNIGIAFKKQKNYSESLKFLQNALQLSKSISLKRFERDILLEISNVYALMGSFDKGLEFHRYYSALNDSIFHQDIENKITDYELRFEKQKNIETITSFKLSQEIYFRNFLILALILTTITLVSLYYFYYANKRSNKKINQQKEELLELNKMLALKNKQLEEFEDIVNRTKAIVVVWKYEENLPIEFISKNVKEQLGYESDDFVSGKIKWNSLIHPDDKSKIELDLKSNYENKVTEYSRQYRIRNSSGQYRWFEDHNKLLLNEATGIYSLQGIALDINERKALEQQLHNYNEELISLNKVKDKFFSIVAHDLKSPFFGLLGLSNMLNDDFETMEEQKKKEYIAGMNQLIKRVYKLIENLLDWSRIQLNKYEISIKEINIYELYSYIINLLEVNAKEKNITLENLADRNLVIKSDEKMLHSIISNLVSNAVKFTNTGGRIKICTEQNHHSICLSVEDNGIGIEENDIDKIFKIDKKISTVGTLGETGTGLGLLITKEMVEKLHGTIKVESKVNVYTKFIVQLPVKFEEALILFNI